MCVCLHNHDDKLSGDHVSDNGALKHSAEVDYSFAVSIDPIGLKRFKRLAIHIQEHPLHTAAQDKIDRVVNFILSGK